MGIIVNQQDNRSELQKKIAAELSEKAKKKHDPSGELPDGVDDSAFIEGTTVTSNHAWVWAVVIAIVIVVAFVGFAMAGNHK
ncbi:MAG TPA: hypothetical protein VMT96_00925 [Candidatus Bathyarchaeia archaeon]|nr:hypothetical protein [Candidatus Bathyarchaeia archaeon]